MIPAAEVARLAAGLPPQALLVLDGAYAEYVSGFNGHADLVDARDNVVMTRTFSKIYGLGGLRIGWGYGPAHVDRRPEPRARPVQPLHRRARRRRGRGARRRLHRLLPRRERAQPRLRSPPRSPRAGVPSDPSEANFLLARFRDRAEAEACDRALRDRGIIVRKVAGYKLPAALRITVGDAEACAPGRRGGGGLHEGARLMRYRHVALIGLGLIASSISHAMRRAGCPVRITGHARTAETRAEAARLGLAEVFDTAAEAVDGADLVMLCVPVGAMARGRRRDRAAPEARRHRHRRRLGQARGDRRRRAAPARRRSTSSPATRWPAPSIPAPAPASPSSSTTAGAC